ncbi:hypothetical protein [Verrucosispora sp. WMMD1129]|uniref:hypothetical protein n=1 Tax=Verrucosispora sp. WMMD1129 TaxID=3016093 RepID=UPI00249BAC38|nr:hypothetical protein [Verrucosispora sp. WMMD1129]WFE45339.1 hypothetical protein O7624_13740 [Verrucosispora sp. WMMD1129]
MNGTNDLTRALNNALHGSIVAIGQLVDAGEMTAEQALARIRARQAETQAAIDAVRTQDGAR